MAELELCPDCGEMKVVDRYYCGKGHRCCAECQYPATQEAKT